MIAAIAYIMDFCRGIPPVYSGVVNSLINTATSFLRIFYLHNMQWKASNNILSGTVQHIIFVVVIYGVDDDRKREGTTHCESSASMLSAFWVLERTIVAGKVTT